MRGSGDAETGRSGERVMPGENFIVYLTDGTKWSIEGASPDEEYVSFRIGGSRGGHLYNNVLTREDLGMLRNLFELAEMAASVSKPDFPFLEEGQVVRRCRSCGHWNQEDREERTIGYCESPLSPRAATMSWYENSCDYWKGINE